MTAELNKDWTIWGISELGCWLGHSNPTFSSPSGHDAEDCLDAHLDCDIRHVVWDLGRSVLNYHSKLPNATCLGLRKEPENISPASIEKLYRERCQLRASLRHAVANDMVLYGRLCMNRHYSPGRGNTGKLFEQNPQWFEQRQDGWIDTSRVCYGIPAVRRERIDVFMEAAGIGVHGLHLDFCRQPPMVNWHPAFVNGYRERTGQDPRTMEMSDKTALLDWCRYRAESVTALLRELKAELDPFRERWLRPVPVQVRVPNDGFEANLVAGLDVIRWCEEGLIDELMLSELHWHPDYQNWDDRPYIELGAKHGIPVFGSSNCLPRQSSKWKDGRNWSGQVNPHGINPLVLARRALQTREEGAQGIALYQSDTGVQDSGMREAVARMAEPEALRAYINDTEVQKRWPITEENREYGVDNHSQIFA